MIIHWHTVITQDVDLLGNLLTTLHTSLQIEHLRNPLIVDFLGDVFCKFWIFQILGIRVDWIHGRITLLVRTVLFQSVEATSHLLRVLSHWLFQVTTGR